MEIIRANPSIGAEIIGIDLNQPISDSLREQILQAYLDYHVLFFRDQNLSPRSLVDFGKCFGEFDIHPATVSLGDGLEAVQILENKGDRRQREWTDVWHSDVTCFPRPYKGALLSAQILPELGGDTLWSNLHAAYELLPDRTRKLIDGLEAWHAWPVWAKETVPLEHYRGVVQPVVRVHPETGRKSLFVNDLFTVSIVGMRPAESRSLLSLLIESIKTPETQVRFRWTQGTVAVWDNRCTAHYASLDYTGPRVMHRVTLVGDKPLAVGERPSVVDLRSGRERRHG